MNADDVVLTSVFSVQDHNIRLTYRQWVHITESHDYMVGNREKVLETVTEPDCLVTGDLGATIALRHYMTTNLDAAIISCSLYVRPADSSLNRREDREAQSHNGRREGSASGIRNRPFLTN